MNTREKVAAVAAQDRKLKPLYAETRPTCDGPGVLIRLRLDEGKRPIQLNPSIEGRLTIEQAAGLAKSLMLMVTLSREEHPREELDP